MGNKQILPLRERWLASGTSRTVANLIGGYARVCYALMLRTTLLIGIGGFVGANLRYWLGGWIAQRTSALFPVETMLINIAGSFLLGLFMTLALHYVWAPEWRQAIAVGFLGSFTTYSTYEYESLRLLQQGLWLQAGLNLIGSLVLGLIAVALGVLLGRWLIGGATP